eukprot:gene3001-5790_t
MSLELSVNFKEKDEPIVTSQPGATTELPEEGFVVSIPSFQEQIDETGTYITYNITSKFGPNNILGVDSGDFAVFRRYKEFTHLVGYLHAAVPHVIVPPLPEKKTNFKWRQLAVDISDEIFITKRKVVLSDFLRRCLDHPVICKEPGFLSFLKDDQWKENLVVRGFDGKDYTYTGPEFFASVRAMATSRGNEPPPTEIKHLKALSTILEEHCGTVLNSHARLAYKVQNQLPLYKALSDEFGSVANQLIKLIAPLRSVSKDLNSMVQITIRRLQHEERAFADALFTFVGYSESISSFAHNEELVHANKNRAVNAYEGKLRTITSLEKPEEDKSFSGFFTRLATSEANKSTKLETLKMEADELKTVVDSANETYKNFSRQALKEIQRFSVTKKHEFLSILKDFAHLQKEHARIMCKLWSRVQQAVASPVCES